MGSSWGLKVNPSDGGNRWPRLCGRTRQEIVRHVLAADRQIRLRLRS